MDINTFKTNPIRVGVYSPTNNQVIRTYVCIGDVPKQVLNAAENSQSGILAGYFGTSWKQKLSRLPPPKTITGGDEDSDIEDLLNVSNVAEKETGIKEGLEIQNTIQFYPEDRLTEMKEKIFILTGIPVYRQHIFYVQNGKITTTYKFYSEGVYNIDCRDINRKDSESIFGIPIDRNIYDNRFNNKIESYENFQIMRDIPHDIYVVDLAMYTKNIKTQLQEVINDQYQIELFYYGFILIYWPILTLECFLDFINQESELPNLYPQLAKNKLSLTSSYLNEKQLINQNYNNIHKLEALSKSKQISVAISSVTAYVNTPRTIINIRNLFDKLRVSHAIPEIHARFNHENRNYLVRKVFVKHQTDIIFPTAVVMKQGVTIAIQNGNSFLFLSIHSDGRYYVKTNWNEEDEYGFNETLFQIKRLVDPVIKGINKLDRIVFTIGDKLTELTMKTIHYHGLNVCIFWKKILLDGPFKIIRQTWDTYIKARVASTRNVQQFDKYEFMFRKGMYQFDPQVIEKVISAASVTNINNYYVYLSNSVINQKWEQNYDGRVVRMMHRISDVKFEIVDVREDEFDIFYRYLLGFIHHASSILPGLLKNTPSSSKDVKKLRKLREQDPELYNLKKFGSKNDYSVRCQNPRQPLIYTDDELQSLNKTEKAKLTKYWNFTMNKPAFYGCPSSNYPHLSFIVGVHPKHYCLPCCNKRQTTEDSSKRGVYINECLTAHTVKNSSDNESKHIMTYGKKMEYGRLSRVHPMMTSLFMATDANFYLYGVNNDNSMGVFYSLCEALELTPEKAIGGIVEFYRKTPRVFYTTLGGKVSESFIDLNDFIKSVENILKYNFQNQDFNQWTEFFIEAFYLIYDVITVIFVDASENFTLNLTPTIKSELKYLQQMNAELPRIKFVMLNKKRRVYPVFEIDASAVKNRQITKRWFEWTSPVGELLRSVFDYSEELEKSKYLNLDDVTKNAHANKLQLVIKYINKRNLCYGLSIRYENKNIYVPIEYSTYLSDNVPISFESYPTTDLPTLTEIEKLANILELEIGNKYSTQNHNYLEINGSYAPYIKDEVNEPLYDVASVNECILQRAVPIADRRQNLISESLYRTHIYDLFVLQFVNFTENEKNQPIRNKLNHIVDLNTAQQREELKTLLDGWNDDLNIIRSQLAEYHHGKYDKKQLIELIHNTKYDFDRATVAKLKTMPSDMLYDSVLSIMKGITVEKDFDMSIISFENIYQPCGTADSGYCMDKKLIINPNVHKVSELSSVLANDLRDPLRSKYLLDSIWESTVINYFDFIKYPLEKITIYKLYI